MRISFGGGSFQLLSQPQALQQLLEALPERGLLTAVIRRLTPDSAFLQLEGRELQLPLGVLGLERGQITEGSVLEIEKRDGQTFTCKILPPSLSVAGQEDAFAAGELSSLLLDLDVEPAESALFTARSLLEQGYPVEKGLLRVFLPWAERGLLEEAFLLARGKFPLRPELAETAQQLKNLSVEKALFPGASESLPPDLQPLFQKPQLQNRFAWNGRFEREELFKSLAGLLVKERLLEALLNFDHKQAQQADLAEYVFALPFLQGEDLYAAWVCITREQQRDEAGEKPAFAAFRIKLQIPTKAWGVVEVNLNVMGKSVRISLLAGGEQGIRAFRQAAGDLEAELSAAGWKAKVGGWEDAKSSGSAL